MKASVIPKVLLVAMLILSSMALNAGCCYRLMKKKRRRFLDVILFSLFISNMIQTLGGYIFTMSVEINRSHLMNNMWGCQFSALSIVWSTIVNIYHVSALCVHRYIQFFRPMVARKVNNSKRAASLIVVLTWVTASFVAMPPMFDIGKYIFSEDEQSCTLDFNDESSQAQTFMVVLMIVGYFLPFVTIMTTSISIGRFKMPAGQDHQRRFIIMEVCMSMAFFITWTPYLVIAIMMVSAIPVPGQVQNITGLIAKMSSVTNSLIYVIAYRLYPKSWCGSHSGPIQDMSDASSSNNTQTMNMLSGARGASSMRGVSGPSEVAPKSESEVL